MIRAIAFIAGLAPALAFAQSGDMVGSGGKPHGMTTGDHMMMHGQPMDHRARGETRPHPSEDKAHSPPFRRLSGS